MEWGKWRDSVGPKKLINVLMEGTLSLGATNPGLPGGVVFVKTAFEERAAGSSRRERVRDSIFPVSPSRCLF